MLEEIVKNVSGTISIKIRLRNRSPMGRIRCAHCGAKCPIRSPVAIDAISKNENP